jgi:hypothetical protein
MGASISGGLRTHPYPAESPIPALAVLSVAGMESRIFRGVESEESAVPPHVASCASGWLTKAGNITFRS